MPKIFSRTDESFLGRWWWSIDRGLFWAILSLFILGSAILFSAGTSVAARINLLPYYFFIKQTIFMVSGIALMIIVSFFSVQQIKRLSIVGMFFILIALLIVLCLDKETKGAARWISIFGFQMQPSEFAKPLFAICIGWLFSTHFEGKNIPGIWLGCSLYVLLALSFILQPDLGQTVILTSTWIAQFIVIGLPLTVVVGLVLASIIGLFGAYFIFDHVKERIDKWLDPGSGDTYQIQKSLEAFADGGIFGVGPGQGKVKNILPDVHADFIFSVVGEETGVIGSLFIIAIFIYIIHKLIKSSFRQDNLFIMISLVGLTTQFSVQTAINLASSIGLIPSKGMTLPFISYGGSSLFALAGSMGIILSFTRK